MFSCRCTHQERERLRRKTCQPSSGLPSLPPAAAPSPAETVAAPPAAPSADRFLAIVNPVAEIRVLKFNEHLSQEPALRIDEALGYTQRLEDVSLTWQCGQHNLGNTCYANSLLIALASVPALRSWFLQHATLHEAPVDRPCLLCIVASDITMLAASPCKTCIQPATVLARRRWCPEFAKAAQQDVCEFWTKLSDACNAIDCSSYSDLVGHLHYASAILYTTPYWKRCGLKGHTKTTCRACGFATINHEYAENLKLAFPDGRSAHLKDCLRQYFAPEILPAPDRCEDGCQGVGCRDKSTVTDAWPEVLCIQLKRWIPTLIPGLFLKERRDLVIPLILDHFQGGPTFEYVSHAAIIHEGDAGGGHYFTLFNSMKAGVWMLANDTSVTMYTGDVQKLLKQSFLMFYATTSAP